MPNICYPLDIHHLMITIQYLPQNSCRKWNLTQYETPIICYKKFARKKSIQQKKLSK
jgi:hypothetical protein